jgi:hypothetical protein
VIDIVRFGLPVNSHQPSPNRVRWPGLGRVDLDRVGVDLRLRHGLAARI